MVIGGFTAQNIARIVVMVVIVMLSTVLHEVAHAAAANALGDPTAKERGRLTLNPIAHLHPVGSFLLPLIMGIAGGPILAFAKPVPYNPRRLRKPLRDEVLVALAGPACNLVQACVGTLAFRSLATLAYGVMPQDVWYFVFGAVADYVYLNLMLMFFNLIPLPPLDGSSIVSPLLRGRARDLYYTVQQNALPILLAVMYLVPMVFKVDPVGRYLEFTAGRLASLMLGY